MPPGTGQDFIEQTKYQYAEQSPQQRGVPQPPLETPYTKPAQALPPAESIENPLKEIIDARATLRAYADAPLTQEELGYLLWCTQGVKEVRGDNYATLRTVPSAGARHAFDTYVLANRVDGLEPGLYRYLALEHKLGADKLSPDLAGQLTEACWNQKMVAESAATFIWVAAMERMTWRYVERGYRYIFLDAGHVCQNLYLAAEPINCGVCAIGAYDDDQVNQLLNLDGENFFVVYLATVGKKS
jgi:SagB-type dehydrogenase family enzyme